MPQPIAEAVQAAPVVQATDVIVFIQVGDVADLWDREAAPAATSRGTTDLQRSEARGKIAKLRVGEALVAEDEYGVTVDGRPDRIHGGGIHCLAQIDVGDLGAKGRLQRTCLNRHAVLPVCSRTTPPPSSPLRSRNP